MVLLDDVQTRNYLTARRVFDDWFTTNKPSPNRADWWVRLVAALDTESQCRILAHDGVWGGGGQINARQSEILKDSLNYPHDGVGHNGGSVGALQQVPTLVAQAADNPWNGWGTIAGCMALESSIPKFLGQLRVTDDPFYRGKLTASPIVADLLRVQQPLESEVAQNYGAAIVARAVSIAAQFPQEQPKPPTPGQSYLAGLLKRSTDNG
jgi:hypothetical protein